MVDLPDLNSLEGTALTLEQIRGILNQIDLDIMNLVRDGKLSALKYSVGGEAGATTDRAANLTALLKARSHYERLQREMELTHQPAWIMNTAITGQ